VVLVVYLRRRPGYPLGCPGGSVYLAFPLGSLSRGVSGSRHGSFVVVRSLPTSTYLQVASLRFAMMFVPRRKLLLAFYMSLRVLAH